MNKQISRSIGFLGGSFDPVHLGHIHLIKQIAAICQLDEVLLCPTALSPFKQKDKPSASNYARLAMLKLAIEELDSTRIIENEIFTSTPSYTIDTIRALKGGEYKHDQLHLILGQDLVRDFTKWKEYQALIELAPPLVGCRTCKNFSNPLGLSLVEIPILDISSTLVRDRLQNNEDVQELLNPKVEQYIKENHLYQKNA